MWTTTDIPKRSLLCLRGLPGEMTAAPSKSYEGFSLREEIKNLVIAEDSSTVVEIFYDRLIFEITFSSGDGVFLCAGEDGENLNELRKTFRYGQEIVPPEPFREGYAAVWPDFDSADENQTYVPEWRGCDGVKFHVRHFLETLDGDFEEIEESSEEMEGTSGTTTSFDEDDKKSFEGFDFKEVLNAVIKGDGSSTVDFYYERHSFTITFSAPEGTVLADDSPSMTQTLRFGEELNLPKASLAGYDVAWEEVPETCPAQDVTFEASVRARDDTPYAVRHYLESLSGEWEEKISDSFSDKGTTASVPEYDAASSKKYEGFSFEKCESEGIKGDGSSTVKIYYTRNVYAITFEAGEGTFDGGEKSVTKDFKYGADLEIPSAKRAGYRPEWNSVPEVCPSKNETYTVTWLEGNTEFRIRHYTENLDGEWTEQTANSTSGSGKTDSMTAYTASDAKSYEGFAFKKVENVTISGDGSSVVKFYYARRTYTLTFNSGDGAFEGGAKSVTRDLKYGAPVEIPSALRAGYSADWPSVPGVCPSKNETYTVTWIANEDTPYKIKHFLMSLDGNSWDEKTSDEENGQGRTDSTTALSSADAKSYEGFSFDKVENSSIAADGSSVVKFYYRRNLYAITFIAEGGTFDESVTLDSSGNAMVNVIYGGTVTAPIVTRTGYEVSWPTFETCNGAKTYTATWIPGVVAYTVEYWKQNANDDEYVKHSSKSLTGKTGEKTKATKINITGFELREPLAQQQVEIAADGSTVVKIYYDRKTFEITFDAGDGVFLGAGENGEDISSFTKTYRYYQKIPALTPFKDGFEATWSPKNPKGLAVTASTTYSVTWEAGATVDYTVRHFRQNAGNDKYTEVLNDGTNKDLAVKRDTRSGSVGSMTHFSESDAASFTGFHLDRVENVIISADGKSYVGFYYNRDITRLTFNAREGRFSDGSNVLVLEGRYGAAVPVFEKPTRDFWDCKGWLWDNGAEHLVSTALPTNFKDEALSYNARWDANFVLTGATDNSGKDVFSSFSSSFATTIDMRDYDFYLSGRDDWLVATSTKKPIGFHFVHSSASSNSDKKYSNSFYGDCQINLSKGEIKGVFYGKSINTSLSEDYNTITLKIDCKALYAETTKTIMGFDIPVTEYPFGKSGSYTLTFTRKQ